MKITFKDGRSIEQGITSVSISNIKKNEGYIPVVNIQFEDTIGFSDVEDIITEENVKVMIVENEEGVSRTLEGFDKVYMVESISDVKHTFFVSIDKSINNVEENVE